MSYVCMPRLCSRYHLLTTIICNQRAHPDRRDRVQTIQVPRQKGKATTPTIKQVKLQLQYTSRQTFGCEVHKINGHEHSIRLNNILG